ncbi:Helix-turn-helix domain protein [Candidatus Izimaplasma bacterium HR1]|nr:Helix-turn-helix domain protein [Candidatus Izimaplasma bacterium HR1]
MKKELLITTDEEVKIIFDPLRKNIMLTYLREKKSLTAKQVATKINEAPAKVNYHLKKLVEFGALELHKTESINGIIAKYYKSAYESIMFKGGELSNEVYLSQSSLLEEIYDRVSSEFRDDLRTHLNMVANSEGSVQRQIASQRHIMYMTKEEQEEFINTVESMMKQYTAVDETKEVFSLLHAMARIK